MTALSENRASRRHMDDAPHRLELLYSLIEASKAINSAMDLDELLRIILDIAIKRIEAETGTIYLVDQKRKEIWSKVTQMEEDIVIRLPLGRGIAGWVADTGETVNVVDARSHSRFDGEIDARTGFQTRNMLCAPMRDETDQVIGVFQILNKNSGQFIPADEDFLAGLSVHAAIAIKKTELHREALEKRAFEREMAMASEIQQFLLPQQMPSLEFYDIAAVNFPCMAIGGDYYDFIATRDGRLSFAIGDAAGKGIPAALMTATLRGAVHSQTLGHGQSAPAKFVGRINNFICNSIPQSKFITFFYGELEPESGQVFFVNAGHNPPLYLRNNGEVDQLSTNGISLGLKRDVSFDVSGIILEPGEAILLYTDGVTEAMNPDDEEYDEHRLSRLVRSTGLQAASAILSAIVEDIGSFCGNAPQRDDVTLSIIKRL
jgi:sigma-B regulation protein RsbU (phosphoserine phosphatase)